MLHVLHQLPLALDGRNPCLSLVGAQMIPKFETIPSPLPDAARALASMARRRHSASFVRRLAPNSYSHDQSMPTYQPVEATEGCCCTQQPIPPKTPGCKWQHRRPPSRTYPLIISPCGEHALFSCGSTVVRWQVFSTSIIEINCETKQRNTKFLRQKLTTIVIAVPTSLGDESSASGFARLPTQKQMLHDFGSISPVTQCTQHSYSNLVKKLVTLQWWWHLK